MPTSVPRWSDAAPDVDTTGRDYALLAVGDPAVPIVERWGQVLRQQDRTVTIHRAVPGDESAVRWAQRHARSARVGWRFAVAGPEDDVMRACAAVRAAGAIEAEITAHATAGDQRRVLCTHCRTVTTTAAAVGGTTACPGCRRTLLVHHHFSRRHAAYMGFMADAEDLP